MQAIVTYVNTGAYWAIHPLPGTHGMVPTNHISGQEAGWAHGTCTQPVHMHAAHPTDVTVIIITIIILPQPHTSEHVIEIISIPSNGPSAAFVLLRALVI
jgi:hypothetical protein